MLYALHLAFAALAVSARWWLLLSTVCVERLTAGRRRHTCILDRKLSTDAAEGREGERGEVVERKETYVYVGAKRGHTEVRAMSCEWIEATVVLRE